MHSLTLSPNLSSIAGRTSDAIIHTRAKGCSISVSGRFEIRFISFKRKIEPSYFDKSLPSSILRSCSNFDSSENAQVAAFLVPSSWSEPSIAASESQWLKENLKQWLDDEFCPEPANEGISFLCARAYERCLLESELDLGDILLKILDELADFSFKESFHGAFSSANAAVELIAKRVLSLSED